MSRLGQEELSLSHIFFLLSFIYLLHLFDLLTVISSVFWHCWFGDTGRLACKNLTQQPPNVRIWNICFSYQIIWHWVTLQNIDSKEERVGGGICDWNQLEDDSPTQFDYWISLSVLMAISRRTWVSRRLLKQRMTEVVVTTGLLELRVVQIFSQIITTNKPTSSFFYRPDALDIQRLHVYAEITHAT